jgi:hypothetical protein
MKNPGNIHILVFEPRRSVKSNTTSKWSKFSSISSLTTFSLDTSKSTALQVRDICGFTQREEARIPAEDISKANTMSTQRRQDPAPSFVFSGSEKADSSLRHGLRQVFNPSYCHLRLHLATLPQVHYANTSHDAECISVCISLSSVSCIVVCIAWQVNALFDCMIYD